MDENSKKRMRERYLRGMRREVGYAEQKSRKSRGPAPGGRRPPRSRGWDEAEDGDDVAFEKMAPKARAARPAATPSLEGLPVLTVLAVHKGRVVLHGERTARLAPGLAADPDLRLVVGDEVAVADREGQWRVEGLLPRRTVLARQDPAQQGRPLVLAANVDLGVVTVAAADPPPRRGLIDRMLVALQLGGVRPALCVTKIDLCPGEARGELEGLMAPYAELGVPTVLCSTHTGEGVGEVRQLVAGCTAVLAGHSGVGKSSLLNAIDADGARRTGEVRDHDGRGRHTTTGVSMRELEDGTRLIDTPGVRSFGLEALRPEDLALGFPEFAEVERCRFGDCIHIAEPGCAVRAAAESGQLSLARYRSYVRIVDDGS